MVQEKPQRCQVFFHGHVQGVGFRWTASSIATQYSITGYVVNEPDGTVRLVAEGHRREVSQMIQSLLHRMSGYVTRHDPKWGPATGEFQEFSVRKSAP